MKTLFVYALEIFSTLDAFLYSCLAFVLCRDTATYRPLMKTNFVSHSEISNQDLSRASYLFTLIFSLLVNLSSLVLLSVKFIHYILIGHCTLYCSVTVVFLELELVAGVVVICFNCVYYTCVLC